MSATLAATARPVPGWLRATRAGILLAAVTGLPAALFQVDPVHATISDAAYQPGGTGWLAASVGGLLLAAGATAVGVRRSPATTRMRGPLLSLLAVWALSLVAVVAFPTNLPGAAAGLDTRVHQVAAGGVVIAPMLLAVLVVPVRGSPGARALRAGITAVGALGVVFAVLHVPVLLATGPVTTLPYVGLVERLMLLTVLVVVLLTTTVLAGTAATAAEVELDRHHAVAG